MKRKTFLQLPLLGAALAATIPTNADRPSKGFMVPSKTDRRQKELHIMGGEFGCLVSSDDSNGDLLIYDTWREEKGGPAYHFHHEQDEWFYVITGEFMVKVGDDVFTLKAGDSAFGPRKIPHAFAKVNEGEGRMLVLFQPAGTMEHFFSEMAKLGTAIPKDQETRLKELWASHGMQIVGPPLKF